MFSLQALYFEKKTINNLINRTDVAFQLSSSYYACPMKLIEYMATAKALVAPNSNQENIRELLVDNESAILFNPKDWNIFLKKTNYLLVSLQVCAALGRKDRETVFKNILLSDPTLKNIVELNYES